ncbi:hypothetical protein Taro_043722 [Colocasia esculenta]|uniref:Uncharacterized protein n=1 Tax=Colocasia esculenta TaxID=4460 RepID=A0A843X224_COLES|nr:hypothetical protein [Colocasia esculenta]
MSFKTCWGRVEECWVAGELWNDHKKLIIFPFSSASTCATRSLGVDQRCCSPRSRNGVLLVPVDSQEGDCRQPLSGRTSWVLETWPCRQLKAWLSTGTVWTSKN